MFVAVRVGGRAERDVSAVAVSDHVVPRVRMIGEGLGELARQRSLFVSTDAMRVLARPEIGLFTDLSTAI